MPSRTLRAIAILFYVSIGFTHVVPWIIGASGEAVDAAGKVWQVHDLRETTVAIMLFTMFFFRIARDAAFAERGALTAAARFAAWWRRRLNRARRHPRPAYRERKPC